MSARVWISPIVIVDEGGSPAYMAKALQYCAKGISFFPSKSDGTPASQWVIVAGRAPDWTAADADPDLDDLFGGDLPASINTAAELKTFLRTRTVADVPVARRNKITAVLDKYGIPRGDFTGSTPLWKVWQRVASTLLEKDFNYGGRFNF